MATLTVSTEYTGLRDGNKQVADGSWDAGNIDGGGCGTGFETQFLTGAIGYNFDAANKATMQVKITHGGTYIGKASFDLDAAGSMTIATGAVALAESSDNNYSLTVPASGELSYEIKIVGKLASALAHPWGLVYAGSGGQAKTVVVWDDRSASYSCL